jgi:hypothetical protein
MNLILFPIFRDAEGVCHTDDPSVTTDKAVWFDLYDDDSCECIQERISWVAMYHIEETINLINEMSKEVQVE